MLREQASNDILSFPFLFTFSSFDVVSGCELVLRVDRGKSDARALYSKIKKQERTKGSNGMFVFVMYSSSCADRSLLLVWHVWTKYNSAFL